VWFVAAIALVAISHRLGDNTNDNLSLPGTDSQRATDTLSKSFPAQSNGTSPIVFHVKNVHAGEDSRTSVVSGLVTSARVITAAAMIMVFVFGSFVLNGDPTVKQSGIGLAVAVVLDATVVRCLLVPALMILMGDHNWYFPKWLDRIVPKISIDGAEFFESRDRGHEGEGVAVGAGAVGS
jgi:uncharacterized membrane protein YdfJ with MMPL/SSD domain